MDNYAIQLENFEGPLDLLLHLIKKNEMDVYDIPMAEITRQYLSILDAMKSLNLDLAGWSQIALSIMNTSVHRLHTLHGRPTLAHFNAIPHLEPAARQFAQTHL